MPPRTLRNRERRAGSRDIHANAPASPNTNTNINHSPNTITVQTTTATTTTMMVGSSGVEVEGSRRTSTGEKRQRGLAEFGITRSPHPQGKKRKALDIDSGEETREDGNLGNIANGTTMGDMTRSREQEHTNTPKRRRISATSRVNGSIIVTGTGSRESIARETPRERTREREVTVSMENSLPSPPTEESEGDLDGDAIEVDVGLGGEMSSPSEAKERRGARDDKEKEKGRERNIDEIVFGDLAFKTWYSSFYPKEIVGNGNLENNPTGGSQGSVKGGKSSKSGKSTKGGKDRDTKGAKALQVDRLYVCNWCFGYTVSGGEMARHRECCERKGCVPGNCVYEHEEGGEWSVWEVDGEVEGTFSQSLSLFAKLFLDNKSVFYDVQSFNYFLLVHTNLHTGEKQIIGFFSKEKMSWDNNNLACILVFPPWQKKGLGSILIGCSYEISKREGLLGGPEKPISELGKRGYGRFWGGEIARYLLELEEGDDTVMDYVVEEEEEEVVVKEPAPKPIKKPSGKGMGKGWRKGMKGVGMQPQSVSQPPAPAPTTPKAKAPKLPATPPLENNCGVTTVEAISKDTWIAVEDVLGVLRSMGILEKVEGKRGAGAKTAKGGKGYRVRVDKEMVRRWVLNEGLSLEKCVRDEGFVEGYGWARSTSLSGGSEDDSLLESIEGGGEGVGEGVNETEEEEEEL